MSQLNSATYPPPRKILQKSLSQARDPGRHVLRGVADAGVAGVTGSALLKTARVDPPEIWIYR